MPAFPLATPPLGTPGDVVAELDSASRVVWADPKSAANGLRRCIEAVLEHQGISKTRLTKNGVERRAFMSSRLEEFIQQLHTRRLEAAASLLDTATTPDEAKSQQHIRGPESRELEAAMNLLDAATTLEAVMRIGHKGSHFGSELTSSDCVESAEYLGYALRLLYDTTDAELLQRAEAISKAKGRDGSR
jgi:hypothetical protein